MRSTIILYCLFLAQSFTIFAPPSEKICSTDDQISQTVRSIESHESNILFFNNMIESINFLLQLKTITTAQKISLNKSNQECQQSILKQKELKNNAEEKLNLLYGKNNV